MERRRVHSAPEGDYKGSNSSSKPQATSRSDDGKGPALANDANAGMDRSPGAASRRRDTSRAIAGPLVDRSTGDPDTGGQEGKIKQAKEGGEDSDAYEVGTVTVKERGEIRELYRGSHEYVECALKTVVMVSIALPLKMFHG